jgi:hypothetical protein
LYWLFLLELSILGNFLLVIVVEILMSLEEGLLSIQGYFNGFSSLFVVGLESLYGFGLFIDDGLEIGLVV